MASPAVEPPGRPEPGQILLVVHDFTARSSDELSLAKGDRVELIERDDDFGDGWYLGKHLTNGSTGLFPEVYTKPAPKGPPVIPILTSTPRTQPSPIPPTTGSVTASFEDRKSLPVTEANRSPQVSRHVSASQVLDTNTSAPPSTSPMQSETVNKEGHLLSSSTISTGVPAPSFSVAGNLQDSSQESPVMNETLNVIQEHISNMSTPRHSSLGDRRATNDSESEYSAHLDHRLSYINGEETDEEEASMHTAAEIGMWNANHVADYLASVGVEQKHCEVFREQEITGDVLLGMDQTSVFIKEFDLGSVGRRLKTWQKIKALQDEVKGIALSKKRQTSLTGVINSAERGRGSSTATTTVLPRIPSLMEKPGARQDLRLSHQSGVRSNTMPATPISPVQESPTRPTSESRPSAASIRDLHHSRRQSSIDSVSALQLTKSVDGTASVALNLPAAAHKKQPSFDRNWTMGGQSSAASRPLSAAGPRSFLGNSEDDLPGVTRTTPWEFERGYFSGGEFEGRQRNVLRKRTSGSHSRNSSYTDEQRIRTATTNARHSRFGSVDSIRESHLSPASQKYYGISNARRRTPSVETTSTRPMPPPKDVPSPTVTKLDSSIFPKGVNSPGSPASAIPNDWLSASSSTAPSPRGLGFRTTSDAVTAPEKARAMAADQMASSKDEAVQSPSQAGSSTTSGGPSFEIESPNTSMSPSIMNTPGSRASRKKSKKETSAYTRGLLKKTPQEQMQDCDYSGWMKKKSTNLMTTWKPRLFILKGRRLSYYYSENDEQEQGLIDISFHRVLPADNDRLTGLHATLTGATSSPTSPSDAHTPTIAEKEAAAEPQSSLSSPGGDSMFIFKLVPPRAGLSRAVTFTKPTVHYFAVPNLAQGRLWMAALMKATIDRDDSRPVTTTYQQKTISLAKARAMRHRPPALMNLDEKVEEEPVQTPTTDLNGLNIRGIIFDQEDGEEDSGVSGVSRPEPSLPLVTDAGRSLGSLFENGVSDEPQTA